MQPNEIANMLATCEPMRGEWAEAFRLILKYFPKNADAIRIERLRNVFASLCRIHKVQPCYF